MARIKKLWSRQSGLFGPGGKNTEKGTYRMMVNNLERVKHSFPSRVSAHPKLCGTSLQVHSALPGKATAHLGLLSGPAEIPSVHQSFQLAVGRRSHCFHLQGLPGWAGPCCQMRNERGSPIPDLWPTVGLTQLHNRGKTAASTRQQDKRFYKDVSVWETPAALRYCREEKQGPESCCPGRFSTKACPDPFTAFNRDIPVCFMK